MPNVIGAIRDKWLALGGPSSFLGQPSTDELGTPDGVGRFNHFQGGSIYWTPTIGAHEVHGAIRGKWADMGWERSFLGYPLTDESPTPDGIGRFNHFQGGSIYWTPGIGAHEVHGAIRDKWASMGWERSFLGYPASDEVDVLNGGRVSNFEHGSITWTQSGGAVPSVDVVHHHVDISTPDWLPVGGWVDVVVNKRGDFTFTGHIHNSGFPNIHFTLAIVLMTPSGVGYGFGRDHTLDGTVTIFGRNRDDDWTDTGANQQLAGNWDQVTQSRLHWRLVSHDTLTAGLQGLVEDLVKDAATQLGKAGITALIALI
jgi:uncharacterized protein with LGFP repeats